MYSPKKLILGTVQFGLDYGINNPKGQLSTNESAKILAGALEGGIQCLDTAAGYGSSEEVIGAFVREQEQLPFDIITKFSVTAGLGPKGSLKKSLSRLQVDCLDTILFHSFQHYQQSTGHLEEIESCVAEGLVKKIGVSVYTNEELEALITADDIAVIQAPFNLFDNDAKRGAIFQALKDSGKEVHTRSVFLQGLFFKSYESFPTLLKPLIEPLKVLRALCKKYDTDMASLALCYSLSKPYLDRVLIGVDSLAQLEANLSILGNPVIGEMLEEIDATINVRQMNLLNPALWKK